jgi:hypothetical protein
MAADNRGSKGACCSKPEKVPDIMKETLDYFMIKTGRTGIAPAELTALVNLEKIHTPHRVNKEIAKAVERFCQRGSNLSELTLTYIYKSLQHQNSLKNVKYQSTPKQEIYEEYSPDPYAGAYL